MSTRILWAVAGLLLAGIASASAAPCLIVTVTGAQGGPQLYQGQAGPGTLVQYGDDTNGCNAIRLQFDAGRGTSLRLSQLNIQPGMLNAIFLTHMHSDHSEGFLDLIQNRWHFAPTGPKLDVVCSEDVPSPLGFAMSCRKFVAHVADHFLQAGEIAQRHAEDPRRPKESPSAMASLRPFTPQDEARPVWSQGEVSVSAIRSAHVPGHASYRVDTPAGSVVIGGDAGNDSFAPPRPHSTSDQVERLARNADVIVHSAIHPAMGPGLDSGMPAAFFHRQSTSSDLGAMAARTGAKYLLLTHLIPAPGAERQGVWKVPGGARSEADFRKTAEDAGFRGQTLIARDLLSLRLPAR